MSVPGLRRVATRSVTTVAVVAALAGCGTPSKLDHQEQVAFARECASLIERGLSDDPSPRSASIAGEAVNLDHPSAFYSTLEKLRGPATYNLHDPKRATDTARQPLDNCKTEPRVLAPLLGSTTTTTTTVPGR